MKNSSSRVLSALAFLPVLMIPSAGLTAIAQSFTSSSTFSSSSTAGNSSTPASSSNSPWPESVPSEPGSYFNSESREVPVSPIRRGVKPLSRIALGVGVSPLGIGFQVATNINRHFNVRGTGNFFNYTDDSISTEGFDVTAKINLASAGASVDYYPFHKGFRLSPGILFYNQNKADAVFVASAGSSFSLNDHTYYSASGADGVRGLGNFGLGNGRAAFTMTTGWGNVIPASGRHFTFPFEIGVAFIKDPTVNLTLTGYVCPQPSEPSNSPDCQNIESDATAQADLAAQVKKYQDDVNPLKTYPIVTFGVSYNFRIRKAE